MRAVALLRAINVGGHVVRMEELRRIFSEAGLADVETFIASGNVIFTTRCAQARLESELEERLERELGYRVATFLRTFEELRHVISHHPFEPVRERLYVGFMRSALDADQRAQLLALADEDNALHLDAREIYWAPSRQFSDSKFSGATLEKRLGIELTFRSISSVRKLLAKHGQA